MLITVQEYLKHNPDSGAETEAEIASVLEISEQVIYNHTMGRSGKYDSYPADVQERIRKAICYQADYIFANGGKSFVDGTIPESATVGSFSYSLGGAEGSGGAAEIALCNVSLTYLLPTGLMYRGDVGVC